MWIKTIIHWNIRFYFVKSFSVWLTTHRELLTDIDKHKLVCDMTDFDVGVNGYLVRTIISYGGCCFITISEIKNMHFSTNSANQNKMLVKFFFFLVFSFNFDQYFHHFFGERSSNLWLFVVICRKNSKVTFCSKKSKSFET